MSEQVAVACSPLALPHEPQSRRPRPIPTCNGGNVAPRAAFFESAVGEDDDGFAFLVALPSVAQPSMANAASDSLTDAWRGVTGFEGGESILLGSLTPFFPLF